MLGINRLPGRFTGLASINPGASRAPAKWQEELICHLVIDAFSMERSPRGEIDREWLMGRLASQGFLRSP